MEKTTVIRLYYQINERTVGSLMSQLNSIPDNSRVIFKLISTGGVRSTWRPVLEKVKKLRFEQNCYLIGEGIKFYSAAFAIFILCNERRVVPQSIGMIHLREFSNRDLIQDLELRKEQEEMQSEDAHFMASYTGFSVKEVYNYNMFGLDTKAMLKWKVADKAVLYFDY